MALNLLPPRNLPTSLSANYCPNEQEKLLRGLELFKIALRAEKSEAGLEKINEVLGLLEEETSSQEITDPPPSTTESDVDIFDHYFDVTRAQTKTPFPTLLRSIITSAKAFFDLIISVPELNPHHIKIQKEGLLSYADLFERMLKPSSH
ncbi:MAG: hypothetical protein AAGA18_12680 [Verrucomicrobiota bacterium]